MLPLILAVIVPADSLCRTLDPGDFKSLMRMAGAQKADTVLDEKICKELARTIDSVARVPADSVGKIPVVVVHMLNRYYVYPLRGLADELFVFDDKRRLIYPHLSDMPTFASAGIR